MSLQNKLHIPESKFIKLGPPGLPLRGMCIRVLGRPGCGFTTQAIQVAKDQASASDYYLFSPEEISVIRTMKIEGKNLTFPLVFIRKSGTWNYIGGCDDLIEFLNNRC